MNNSEKLEEHSEPKNMELDNVVIREANFNPRGEEIRINSVSSGWAHGRAMHENMQRFKYNYTQIPIGTNLRNYKESIDQFVQNMEQNIAKVPDFSNTQNLVEKCLPALKNYVQELSDIVKENPAFYKIDNKGGMFVFPLESKLDCTGLYNFISAEYVNWMKHTYSHKAQKALLKIYNLKNIYGCTMGRDFSGRWNCEASNNTYTFNERCTTIDCVGIDEDILHRLAKNICAAFKQNPFIFKSFDSQKVYKVEGNFSRDEAICPQSVKSVDEYFTEKEGIRFFNISTLL